MTKYLLLGPVGILFLVMAACGGDDDEAAQSAPAATTAPASAAAPASLQDVAAKLAGGPGSIYVGDLSQLVGPAPS